MSTRTLQTVALSAVLAAAVIGVVQMRGESEPTYLSVEQIVRDPARWQGESVSVLGIVQPGSRQRDADGDLRFNVVSQGETLSVRFTGVVPSTFVDAAEVMVTGDVSDRELSARTVSVKVPG